MKDCPSVGVFSAPKDDSNYMYIEKMHLHILFMLKATRYIPSPPGKGTIPSCAYYITTLAIITTIFLAVRFTPCRQSELSPLYHTIQNDDKFAVEVRERYQK